MNERLTIDQASRLLGVSPQQLRLWLQNKCVDFGFCHRQDGNKRASYYIFKGRLLAYLKGTQQYA